MRFVVLIGAHNPLPVAISIAQIDTIRPTTTGGGTTIAVRGAIVLVQEKFDDVLDAVRKLTEEDQP